MGWMMLWWPIGVILLVVVLLWVGVQAGVRRTTAENEAEVILKRRYAQGEINREQYDAMLRDLRK